jgi:hypothetical protein
MRRQPAARLCLSLIALVSVLRAGGLARSWADDGARVGLRSELGCELDSNAHRTEVIDGAVNPPLVSSPVVRLVLGATFIDVRDRQQLMLSATGAGKLFTAPAARDEDVLVAQTDGGWRLAVGPRTGLAAQAGYYEAFQRASAQPSSATDRRDFRSVTPSLRLDRLLGQRVDAALFAGYRLFVFKPDRGFDFRAPLGGIDLRWSREADDGAADWELTAGVSGERRAFTGARLINACVPPSSVGTSCLPTAGNGQRRDLFLMSRLEMARTGRALIGVGYALHWNGSNSFGETVTRHFATLRLTAPLPLQLYLAARAELVIAEYTDPVTVGQGATSAGQTFVSIEDENRNNLRVDLSRALSDRLQLLARYTLYVNEIGTSSATGGPARFRRQTILLTLAFAIGP